MRYKSFDQFVSEMDRSEEIEKEIQDVSTPEQSDVEDTETEADKVQTNEAEETPAEEAPAEETKEEEKAEEVSQILEKCYESVVVEAKAWETDAHDDHTIEAYMCENAALVAGLAAKACKDCKEEYGEEAYEAALNMIKEAFSNKIEEIKITMNGETPADAEEKSAD
jgi:hypothetical protein